MSRFQVTSSRKAKSHKAQRNPGRKPTHPGALLRDELLQNLHDLWHEERALKDTLGRIKTMKAA